MKKVLLISANMMKNPYPVYPLGLDYVAGSLHSRYETKILDMNDFPFLETLGEQIRRYAPDYIGLSIRNIDNTDTINSLGFLSDYQDLAAVIRQNSDAALILGGSGYTIFPVEFVRALHADYGIAGEGERLSALLHALDNKTDVTSIPGIVTGLSQKVSCRAWDGAMNRAFEPDAAHVKYYLSCGGMLNLQTKRGCPFRCSYCTYPHIEGRRMRFFAPAEIAKQARDLQEAGAKYIFLTDSAFNASYDHSLQVAEAFRKSSVTIPWGGFFAPTVPPDDYYRKLAAAGLTHVEFGTESMSDAMLTNLQKPFASADVFRAHQSALAAGLHIAHYFLLGGPGENEETLQDTLNKVDQLNRAVFFFFCGIRIYPHTDLYDTALREGQISASQNLIEPVFYRSPFISGIEILKRVETHAGGRQNWLVGAGENKTSGILPRLYERGYTGPLWEYLI
ncbi:MAG: B12-binding domain-containing radical SAM protein [Deltaproteobacteria bacterium HGW-Deltaproteobacteria-6]|nr:MAG: B12-binding domain-containing radical SAM protein [Deltaproteobacteria bacterium HGW-Deltaproteobacteria-6]